MLIQNYHLLSKWAIPYSFSRWIKPIWSIQYGGRVRKNAAKCWRCEAWQRPSSVCQWHNALQAEKRERKETWLPDGYSQILDLIILMCLALWASGLLLRYATLQNLIPGECKGAIQGKEGTKFWHLATLEGKRRKESNSVSSSARTALGKKFTTQTVSDSVVWTIE